MHNRIAEYVSHYREEALAVKECNTLRPLAALVIVFASTGAFSDQENTGHYGIGATPSELLISTWDIAIGPDGEELPEGRGSVADGKAVYAERCAVCHGATGIEGPDPILVGGHGSLTSDKPVLTVGSYWAFATTLFDYIYRAMPFVAPGSLSADEVYALCAFLLNANDIVDENVVMDRDSLPAVRMPNRDGFVPDPRPAFGDQKRLER
jgi:cytochrome c